jgi:hypothetical protein
VEAVDLVSENSHIERCGHGKGDEDVQRLLKTRTGDRITIIGTIADIRRRSMVILSPARLSP